MFVEGRGFDQPNGVADYSVTGADCIVLRSGCATDVWEACLHAELVGGCTS